jgi:hypothetical protein
MFQQPSCSGGCHDSDKPESAVLMSTHYPEPAKLGDRIVHMRDGEVVRPEDDPQWVGLSKAQYSRLTARCCRLLLRFWFWYIFRPRCSWSRKKRR